MNHSRSFSSRAFWVLAACSMGCSTNVDLAGTRQKAQDGGEVTPGAGGASNDSGSPTGSGGAPSGGAASGGASNGGAAGSGGCTRGNTLPVDLYLMYDQSQSLSAPAPTDPTTTWWVVARDGVVAFLNNPRAAGAAVGIQFFPYEGTIAGPDPGLPTSSCYVANYATPEVELGLLPGNAPMIIQALQSRAPTTFTPTVAALVGAIQHMKEWGPAHPGRVPAVVLVTDGFPTECDPQGLEAIAQIAADAYSNAPSVLTFVAGLQNGQSMDNFNVIAAAGGTEHARIVTGADPGSALTEALLEIATPRPGCIP